MSEKPDATQRAHVVEIAGRFAAFPQVRAIALGGSQAAGVADPGSDFDLYIYVDADIPLHERTVLADEYAGYAEVGNRTWGDSDEWVTAQGSIHVDLVYFGAEWMEEQLERVLARHEGSVGYSTAFWHTVLVSQTIYDPTGWFAELQDKAQRPYPEALRRDIIARNYPILRQPLASYRYQLGRAVNRGDMVSTNHRVAAMLASVFDIIFAVNRLPHPGEKRLAAYVRERCALVPPDFQEQLTRVLEASGTASSELLPAVDAMLDGLDELLRSEGLIEALQVEN